MLPGPPLILRQKRIRIPRPGFVNCAWFGVLEEDRRDELWLQLGDGRPEGAGPAARRWQVGSPDPTGWSKNWKPADAPHMVLLVDDCYKMFAELQAKGVEFRRKLEEYPQSVSATFSDSDGNLFTIRGLPQRDSWDYD
ncbi:MAG TPA: VOC family protein [Nitrososphaerales archaeon]|nr:VOC family protein [Nitrososphaerales archaeon]